MSTKVETKTGWEDIDQDYLTAIMLIVFATAIASIFFLSVFITVAVRQGHWYFPVADFIYSFGIFGVCRLLYRNLDKLGRQRKRMIPTLTCDSILWIAIAIVTGFSWTLITYTIYAMLDWIIIWSHSVVVEFKRRNKKKNEDNITIT